MLRCDCRYCHQIPMLFFDRFQGYSARKECWKSTSRPSACTCCSAGSAVRAGTGSRTLSNCSSWTRSSTCSLRCVSLSTLASWRWSTPEWTNTSTERSSLATMYARRSMLWCAVAKPVWPHDVGLHSKTVTINWFPMGRFLPSLPCLFKISFPSSFPFPSPPRPPLFRSVPQI